MYIFTVTIVFTCFYQIASSLPYDNAYSSSARIVNGFEVDITEVPYQAALRRRNTGGWSHACGAVVISNTVLLSAAHCLVDYIFQPSFLRVAVGTSYRLSGGKTYTISKILVHENYSSVTLEHDIGMLKIEGSMKFQTTVNAISIAPSDYNPQPGTEALVTGYGATSYYGAGSSMLMGAYVHITDQNACVISYKDVATVTSGMICAHGTNPNRDACSGDSGGPLVINNVLVGLVSWGEGCADERYPGVYTRISSYSTWITKKTKLKL